MIFRTLCLTTLILLSPAQTETGIVQGTVRVVGGTEPVSGVQITLEGGPADPKTIPELVRSAAGRGIVFTPKSIGTVDEVLQELADVAGSQGVGLDFPLMRDGIAAFRAANAARFSATSDRDGRFSVKDLPPGTYIVRGAREGFTDPTAARGTAALKVTVSGKDTATVTVSMLAGAVISGRVRDDNGRPVKDIEVSAMALVYQNGGYPAVAARVTKRTDDLGEYRLFWLDAGEYYVMATPPEAPATSPTQPMRTFYPDVVDVAVAAPIVARAGDQLSGIDIRIRNVRMPRISGTVTTTIPPEETAAQAAVLGNRAGFLAAQAQLLLISRDPNKPDISSTDNLARNVGTAILNPITGTFETRGVLPGSYDIYARIPESNANGGAGLAWGRAAVEVGNDNATGVSITVHRTVTVNGTVTVDGRPTGNTPVRVLLQPVGSGVKVGVYNSVAQRPVPVNPDGSFSILAVPPGLFRVDVGPGLPKDLYIADVRQNAQSVYDAGADIGSQAPAAIQVMLRSGSGSVEGTVQDATGKPVAGALVVLVPNSDRRQNRTLYRSVNSDASGRFVIQGIAPLGYKLFAWQQTIPAGAFYNPGFLGKYEDRGRAINVSQGGTVTQQLTAIP